MTDPTIHEALGDALTALEALVHAYRALTPTQARLLRRIHSGLSGLVLDQALVNTRDPGAVQALVDLAQDLGVA